MTSSSYHFVLVPGLGHGAWCWYKVTAMLQAAGHTVTALDLTSCGIDKTVADTVASVAEYMAPLTDFLAHSVVDHDQVILVGHSLGGSSIAYAMELFPKKIYKAIFLNAFMPISGDIFLDLEALKEGLTLGALQFANNREIKSDSSEPTSIYIDAQKSINHFYNKCSMEDVRLAQSCLNPSPYVLTKEILHLTPKKYGSVPRFYVTCLEDNVVPPSFEQVITSRNPPLKIFTMPNSDHSPFFCEPRALVDIFLAIAHS